MRTRDLALRVCENRGPEPESSNKLTDLSNTSASDLIKFGKKRARHKAVHQELVKRRMARNMPPLESVGNSRVVGEGDGKSGYDIPPEEAKELQIGKELLVTVQDIRNASPHQMVTLRLLDKIQGLANSLLDLHGGSSTSGSGRLLPGRDIKKRYPGTDSRDFSVF